MALYLTQTLFPAVLNMSLTASIVIAFVLAVRLFLKKAPKVFSYALWGVVLFRLLCPVSIPLDLSLMGLLDSSAAPVTQHTTTVEHIPQNAAVVPILPNLTIPMPDIDRPADDQPTQQSPTIPSSPNAGTADNIEPSHSPIELSHSAAGIACAVWLGGVGVMLLSSAVSFLRLRRKLVGAARLYGNIYLADYLDTPFVMGLLRAKIYLPSSLSEREQRYILLHEQQHIRRLDHIVKTLAFLAFSVHWFNPLVWLAFVLSAKDMEMSCDEAVMKQMGEDIRAEYSASLLSLATGRRIITGTPLAFGEDSTKSRVKNVLHWKKPKVWIILTAAVLCTAVIIFCAGNPDGNTPKTPGDDTTQTDDAQADNTSDEEYIPLLNDPNDAPTPLFCTHPKFTIALESHPLWMTTVQWFCDHGLNTRCEVCGNLPMDEQAVWTSFSDCLDGLENGTYDVVLIPYDSDRLAELDGYTVVPIQRDAFIFVRSNAEERAGFDLTDETIRRAFTSDETVYWDAAQTDPIIPASGWPDEQSCWPQITHLFGIEPTSSQIVFRGTGADNAPMAIADADRVGSGLWPHHFSMRNAEAALNGEPISVNGIYPTEQTVADGSYPYSFTYYAVFSPDHPYAGDISAFANYIQQSNCSAYSTITYKGLYHLPWLWEQGFEGVRPPITILRVGGARKSGPTVDGNLISLLSATATRLKQPDDPNRVRLLSDGIRIEFRELEGMEWCYIRLFRTDTAPCVQVLCNGGSVSESAVVYAPQLYLYLTALAERENARLTDLDGDGVLETVLWQHSQNDFVIYDYYGGDYHRISTNETLGCAGSDFTGLIANVLPEYNSMVQAQHEDGTVEVYRYQDGSFSYVCPIAVALGQQPPEDISTPLTDDELACFQGLFANSSGIRHTFFQMLLSCEYAAPELIDFSGVFLEGVPREFGIWGYPISTAEQSALRAVMGAAYRDNCRKIPRAAMEELLMQYLGLGIADTQCIGLNQFTYLEQYDAYYICASTKSRVIPQFSSGIRRADGTVELRYHKKSGSSDSHPDTHVLVLSPSGDSYRFVANLKLLPTIDMVPYRADASHTISLNGFSESENKQIAAVLHEFFDLHAASLAGVDLDRSPWIQSDLYHYVRTCAQSLRAGYADSGNSIIRCAGTYEVLREQHDGEWLTLTVREWLMLDYTMQQFETPVRASSNLSVTHVLRLTKTQSGEYYLAAHGNDWHYAHYYTNTDRVAANTDNGVSAADNLDLLPTVSYFYIRDGFLYGPDGVVMAVSDGAPVKLVVDYWSIPLKHNGWELTVFYGWTQHGNTLATTSKSPYYSIQPVPQSGRYLKLILDGGYTYLIDTASGTILNPLAVLDSEAAIRLHSVEFSPDGQYAVVSHHGATVCVLLNCTTGEITQLPYASGLYSVFGYFLDNTHILLMSAVETDPPHEVESSWAVYDITTGTLTELTGEFAPGSTHIVDDGQKIAYTYQDGYLVIIDLLQQEKIVTQIRQQDVERIFYCPNTLAGVICGDVVSILDYDGSCFAVCKVVRATD